MIHIYNRFFVQDGDLFSFLCQTLYKQHVIKIHLLFINFKGLPTAVIAVSFIRMFLCLFDRDLRIDCLGTLGIPRLPMTKNDSRWEQWKWVEWRRFSVWSTVQRLSNRNGDLFFSKQTNLESESPLLISSTGKDFLDKVRELAYSQQQLSSIEIKDEQPLDQFSVWNCFVIVNSSKIHSILRFWKDSLYSIKSSSLRSQFLDHL